MWDSCFSVSLFKAVHHLHALQTCLTSWCTLSVTTVYWCLCAVDFSQILSQGAIMVTVTCLFACVSIIKMTNIFKMWFPWDRTAYVFLTPSLQSFIKLSSIAVFDRGDMGGCVVGAVPQASPKEVARTRAAPTSASTFWRWHGHRAVFCCPFAGRAPSPK